MPWYVLVTFLTISGVALYHAAQALRNLEERGENRLAEVVALGIFAGRERFTTKGWKHRQLASAFQIAAIIAGLILWALSGTLF